MIGVNAWGWPGPRRACAAPGSSSRRPEQSPGGEGNSRSLEGADSRGGDGGKGPKSGLAVTERPGERLQGGRGGVARCPRQRSWKRAAFASGSWDDTGAGWGGCTACAQGRCSLSPPLMGPECSHVRTRPHHHPLRAHPFPLAPRRETPKASGTAEGRARSSGEESLWALESDPGDWRPAVT